MVAYGNETRHCSICGLRLDDIKESVHPSIPRVVMAEDSSLLREMASDALKDAKLAGEVLSCDNGREFVDACRKIFQEKESLGLAIVDINMPILGGVEAARELRVMEKEFERPFITPILFFSVRTCDQSLKEALNTCHPSAYVNKGVNSSPEKLAQRICTVVRKLLSSHREGWDLSI